MTDKTAAGVAASPWIFTIIPASANEWLTWIQITGGIVSIVFILYHIREKKLRIKLDKMEIKEKENAEKRTEGKITGRDRR